ncbi:MAG: hypothetical protein JWN31_970, partial [Frankiales bacterium]|nr:hypothetical protein [Frankiales bacterium]
MPELVYPRLFLPAAERHAQRTAITDGDYSATFSEHAGRAIQLANALSSGLGLRPSDRFAVVSLNSHRYLELYHAAFLGGAMIVPVNYRLADPEIGHVLQHSGARVVFVDAFNAPRIQAIVGDLDLQVVSIEEDYEKLLSTGEQVLPAEPAEDDTPMVMYTGGTTGLPKGV